MIRSRDSLEYHAQNRPGKIEVRATKPCFTVRDMRLAYLPGAAFPAEEIARDPSAVFRYTSRGNLVGLVTNGTAVPGLGNVGPEAAKPMQEGMAVLFKRLADIDVFDLEIRATDPDRFVETVATLEPTFGAINLKDLRAPEGLSIYERLKEALGIPVFHENLYGTAVVAAAAFLNGLDLAEKRPGDVRVVLCGAGSVGTGCARLLLKLGVKPENLWVYDIHGLLHPDRKDLAPFQRELAGPDAPRDLAAGLKGADVFVGASTGGILTQEMIRSMGRFPLVLALATPEPEIGYPEARASRHDAIVATSLAQHPNTILDILSFPYIFRGALDVQATRITEGMLLAAARSLAELAREEVPEEVERAYGGERFVFGPEYLLPKAIDPRILLRESTAVAQAAIAEKVARSPIEPEAHEEALRVRLGTGRDTMRHLIHRARQAKRRVAFAEGSHETILRAASLLSEDGIAEPILLGREEEVRRAIERLNLDAGGMAVVDPAHSPAFEGYAARLHEMRRRRGVMASTARSLLARCDYFGAMMLESGDVDLMVSGIGGHYAESLRPILDVIGPAPGIARVSGLYLVLLPRDVYVLADCAVNIDPTAEELAETALLAARSASNLGLEPRVAMLSFSNFGSVGHNVTRKVRQATEIARAKAPELTIDGEMQLATALDGSIRSQHFPFTRLTTDANVLVFPDLQSGNLSLQMLQYMGEAVPIGPVLIGTRKPAHVLQYGMAVKDVVNVVTVGLVEAAG
jgi:malate dehydrogenase (oxaloacetate-decarboxylating)(NADP+)